MYEKVEKCPSCNSSNFSNYTICDDHSVSHESFAIMQCNNCQLLVTSPRPDHQSITKYYESEEYISHTGKSSGPITLLYRLIRKQTLKKKLKLISKLSTKRKILDYGSGTGEWLDHCNKNGWKTTGIEPSNLAREFSEKEYNLNVSPSLNQIEEKKFSIITLWHVLEHVHHLNELLNDLNSLLSKTGKLIIAVPNHDSYDRKFYKEFWAGYDVHRHLYHFNQLTIKDLLHFHGFKLEKTIPMKYDSYYVSMLSEKYKKHKLYLLKSFIIGWFSNRWARKNENNYSSLTYVFSKA